MINKILVTGGAGYCGGVLIPQLLSKQYEVTIYDTMFYGDKHLPLDNPNLNIIKGDMSIVGPRPLLIEYLSLYNDEQKQRHLVKPGLTGWAQVNGRNASTWEQRFANDIYYISSISLLLDVKIVLKTFVKVFKRSGISGSGQATMEKFTGE